MATSYEILEDGEVPVLVIDGELGQGEVRPFDAKLDELAARSAGARVVDLTACPFITSLTVPCLLRAADVAREAGGRLWIAAGEGLVTVLRVLRLETRLNLFESRELCLEKARAYVATGGASEAPPPPEGPDDEAATESHDDILGEAGDLFE